ncbi:uncharacterized protein ANIA_10735 [Aspergillus nidulans FGSC A4]|uniref:Involucrin repeat protein n=1 Tax=Emericella nidulans (strain FGSC A4 / ATCC 38163 / CBS 112.46 / NRRL 194 / M139) TaxID=227321 RepID=C8V007_EMENI|nr:hypothetical protein [Aspergillus nidulans FGSC A4]CBF70709.1 TPA: hypothetical protein ANIA_10735 [Aspergillus nidulans FGSC A4]
MSLDSERDQPFLVERPEMPVSPLDTGEHKHGHEYEYGSTSGPKQSSARPAEEVGGELGLGIISRRPRSHSTTPPSSEKIVPDSGFRSISPGPRRPSLSRFADSPTAVPLHFRPPPSSPRLQRSPSVTSPPGASPVSPSQQGRRSRPNSLEFKNSREIRPLFLVERLGSSKIDQGQFGDEALPSLPSSKSASTEDLTALRDENTWEVQPVSIEQHHDILGSQQNTPTGATFGSGIPRHLSRKEELGYEFHSPSELLRDAELSSYPDLPESLKEDVALPSAQGSVVGVETDLENLPPLPDSRPSSPDDKDDFVSVSDAQMVTPTQGAETAKGLASAERDIPGLDLYNGTESMGSVDAAMAASSASTPYPDTKLLADSKRESLEAEVEGQDDDARTVTGNDVPTLADLTPSHSPRTVTERDYIHPTPWGFASIVGATMAATANVDNAVQGEFSMTTPSETNKPAESVADTTEDEFFDAMSRDEADHNVEEKGWETDLPSGIETLRRVESGLYEPFAARDVSVTESENVEKDSVLDAETELEHEPQLKREIEPEVETVEAHESEPTTESVQKEPDAPSSEENKETKESGKSLDSSNHNEENLLDTAANTAAPEFTPSRADADANVLSAQAPITAIDQPAEEVHTSILAPETSVIEETEPSLEHITNPEAYAVGGDDSFQVEETPGPITEQISPQEKEPSSMEATPEIVPKRIELTEAQEPASTQAEVNQEVLTETGLSKKAKKKKKKAAKSIERSQDAAVESATALDQTLKDTQESIVDKEPGALETGAVVVSEDKPVEEPAVLTEDVSSGRGVADLSEPVETGSVAEQPAEVLQRRTPDLEEQNRYPTADGAVRPIEAEAETAHESNEPKQEEKDELPQPQTEDIPLSRKASKKKKKNKRKSTAEAEPLPEAASASLPETSEQAGLGPEASVLGDEKSNSEAQEVNFRDDIDILTDAVEGERGPNPKPETKPKDATTPLETSGQVPPPDDNKQVPEAGTEQQATDAQAVDTQVAIKDETVPSHLVEISETNDGQPHVPEKATIELDAGGPASTGKKSKKKNKKKQGVSSVFEEALSSEVAGAPGTDFQDPTPVIESSPDVVVETDELVGSEGIPVVATQDPVEETSRDVELPAEADGALPEDLADFEAAPVTDVQRKAEKKRQSLAPDVPEPETQTCEFDTEKKLLDVPAQDDQQTPETPEPEVEQTDAITPALESPVDEIKELPVQADEQVAEKDGEQIDDEAPAIHVPTVVGEPITTEAVEPELELSQDRATDLAIEGLDTTKAQSTLELQEDKTAEKETPDVAEQPTEPARQDASPLEGNTTVTEPTEDNQPTTSKNAKKKKKKKRQSVSCDENGAEASPRATSAKEEDISENSAERAHLSSQDAPIEPALKTAAEQGEPKEIQTEAAATRDEVKEAEKLEGFSAPAEVTPETPVQQDTIRDSAAPEMLKETTTDDTSVAQHEDTVRTTDEQEITTSSLPGEPTPDPAQSQEQQQSSEPAEEKQTSSSKKKNKKKKKKSLSSTSVDEGPSTAPQDSVSEQEVVDPQAITITAEGAAPDTAAAVGESLPSVPESAEPKPDSPEPASQHPPESTTDTDINFEPKEVATAPPFIPESTELEANEPESQDIPPTDEQQAKPSKKKVKKDKKKRKSVSFAAEESSEQQGETSGSPERTEPAVNDSTEAIELVTNDAPVECEAPSEQVTEQVTASPEPVPGNEPVLEQNEQQILEEPTSNDSPLDDDREVSAVQASGDLLKDGPDIPKTEEPNSASQLEQVESKAMELTAETTTPETGLSKKDKKRAKKEKKRQSKLLAPEKDTVPSTPTEHALDSKIPTNEVAPGTSEMKIDVPAETAFSPAEEDGKDNQSHDTESRGGTDKELTWTDNDVSSQVEKEKQHIAFPVLIPESESESTEVDKGAIEVEPAPTTADPEVVEESQQDAGFETWDDAMLEGQDVSQIEVVTGLGEEVQNESEQKENSDDATDKLEEADQKELKHSTFEALGAVEERLEEAIPEQITEAEAAKEAEPTQSTENVVSVESATEPAVPSRKLSKKQRKKQRQADKAAASQVQEETASTEEASGPPDLATKNETKVDSSVFDGAESDIKITEEPTLQEAAAEATTRDTLEPLDFDTTDHELVEPAFPEAVQDTALVLEETARPESSWVSVDESKLDAELPEFDAQPVVSAPPGPVHDISTSPAPEEIYSSKGNPVSATEPAIQTERTGESSKNQAPESTPLEPAEQKGQRKTDTAIKMGLPQLEGPVPAPMEKGEFEEQLEVVPQVEEKAPQVEAPESILLEATRENEQPKTSLGDLSRDKSREEPPAALDESALTRKESKKKNKKAKKQAKKQEQLEREVTASAIAETKVGKDVKAADAVEAEFSAVEPVESVELHHGSTNEPTNDPAKGDEETDRAPEKPVQCEVIREEREGVPEDTEKELDVPREDIREKMTVESGKEALREKRVPELELQTDSVEAVAKTERMAATAEESCAIEPESAPAPLTRKMSKKEKKKLKKQAEKQEREDPVQTMDAVKDEFSVPQAVVQVPEGKEDEQMLAEPVEVLKGKVSIPGSTLGPEMIEEPKTDYSRELVGERISPTIKSMEPIAEPIEEEGIPLSKKSKENVEELQLEDQQAEQASQPRNQTSHTPPEPVEAQETAREDEDAWPAIDWDKGKIDATDQSAQSSPEAHAAPFVPEIPEFKESAIPEALIERVTGIPEEAAKEGKAQAMTGTIERDVTTVEFNTTGTDSALRALHHVESAQGKKAEEPKTTVPVSDKIASIFPNLERGFFRRPSPNPSPTQSVKDGAEEETGKEASRDNAIQVLEAPIAKNGKVQPEVRDSGYILSPADDVVGAASIELPAKIETSGPPENLEHESRQDTTSKPAQEDDVFGIAATRELPANKPDIDMERPIKDPREGSREESRSIADPVSESGSTCELRRSPSIHGRHVQQALPWSLEESAQARRERDISPSPLPPIAEQEHERAMGRDGTPRLEMKPEHVLPRPETPVRKFTENALGRRAWPTPENESDDDWEKVQKPSPKNLSPERGLRGILKTPEQDKPVLRPSRPPSAKSSTHSLRRVVHSASGDLRAAALAAIVAADEPAPDSTNQSQAAIPQPPARAPTDLDVGEIASSSSYDPIRDKGKKPLRSMTDVYEGWGETPSSPRSPSRPASVRHRRSMQHLQELEFRLEHLLQENRDLAAARDAAEDKLRNASLARRKSDQALNNRDADLRDREAELEQLQQSVEWFQKEVARLNEENAGLTSTNAALIATHTQELQTLRQSSAREIEQLRSQNERLSVDLHERIKAEIETALSQKNAELRRLREELESARDKVKELQQQISAQMNDNVIAFRGEDYFEAACQKLCGHVQQWVLRFSKHSDHRRCRKLIEIKDEKIADRFDNAILDGSDTDAYLADRVRRRDVFMSVVMTMVWEFVFTRYLFGMDREQRQKLKSLEKQLIEVGPRSSIHRWRATTLTLLSRRQAFAKQRDSDTEAVALEIFDTLSRLLPPPTPVESQLLDSLRKVLRVAVNLSIEMRTQLAEYIMLPPLQPEYDTNGDLARQVFFNASLMNERSGETTSNEELQAQNAVVRVVLFPLVVKKGNDTGEGEDEVVVCPAQVLVARPGKDKRLNRMTSSDRMSIDASRSVHSIAPSSMNMSMSNVI